MKYFFFLLFSLFFTNCNDKVFSAFTPFFIEPYLYQQWYLDKNDTFYAKNGIDSDAHIHPSNILDTYRGRGIKIAIIDNGLDATHEDLIGSILNSYDITTKTSNVKHTSSSDAHGTSVTGIIAARRNNKGILGVASMSSIIFLKYKENMSDSETIELFNKAEEFGADIINNSWGTNNVSPAVKNKIVDLAKNGRNGKGTIIVFASGNDNQDMGNDESAIPEVIAVGASDRENLRAIYSNFGKELDIVAPGGYSLGITTLDPMGENFGSSSDDVDYNVFNDPNYFAGTSASAPIVSGIIALMLEYNNNLTRLEIESILHETSDKVSLNVVYVNGRNDYYGYGKVNVTKIFQYLKN